MLKTICEIIVYLFFGQFFLIGAFVALGVILCPIIALIKEDRKSISCKDVIYTVLACVGLALFLFFGSGAVQL